MSGQKTLKIDFWEVPPAWRSPFVQPVCNSKDFVHNCIGGSVRISRVCWRIQDACATCTQEVISFKVGLCYVQLTIQ